MPYLTIVTFTDEDGDEFPVAIVGIPSSDQEAERIGRERAQVIEAEESAWRPAGDLTLARIEYPGTWAVRGRSGPLGRDLTLQGARDLARVSGGSVVEMWELGEEV